jgi:hypothetical protein
VHAFRRAPTPKVGLGDARISQVLRPTIDTGLARGTEFAIEWRLRVRSVDPHDFLDAGIAFMPSYTNWPGVGKNATR